MTMAKKVIIIAIIILGCTTFTYLNESKAAVKVNSAVRFRQPRQQHNVTGTDLHTK